MHEAASPTSEPSLGKPHAIRTSALARPVRSDTTLPRRPRLTGSHLKHAAPPQNPRWVPVPSSYLAWHLELPLHAHHEGTEPRLR